MQEFSDVLISPYRNLLFQRLDPDGGYHKGGPLWPEWERQTAARHCRSGKPCDFPPDLVDTDLIENDAIAWGGAITLHFGHQIADFSMRILPTLFEWPDAIFAYCSHPLFGIRSLQDAPQFFREIVDWLEVPLSRIRLFDQPTLSRKIYVAPQAEQLRWESSPTPAILEALERLGDQRFGKIQRRGRLYVSRAGRPGRIAGEVYLEKALRMAGVDVIRPELLPLASQLRAYSAAEDLVFSEGSALHGVQLLGKVLGNVFVLMHRPSIRTGRPFLEARSRSVIYMDAVVGYLKAYRLNGEEAVDSRLILMDPQRLIDSFRDAAGISLAPHFRSEEFRHASDDDVMEWLGRELSKDWRTPADRERVRDQLHRAGLDRLLTRLEDSA